MATPELTAYSAKLLYNTSGADKTKFIKDCQAKYHVDTKEAERMFNFMASMEKDKEPGLTPKEYKQGLTEKKALAEIRQAKILDRYVPTEERENFAQMAQTEKVEYIAGKIPHESGKDTEAHVMAEMTLAKLNNLDAELEYLNEAIAEIDKYDLETRSNDLDFQKNEAVRDDMHERKGKIYKQFGQPYSPVDDLTKRSLEYEKQERKESIKSLLNNTSSSHFIGDA